MLRLPIQATELTMAIPRGGLFEQTLDLLTEAGFSVEEIRGDERRQEFEVGEGRSMIAADPSDVPAYVEFGAADVGIAGKDVLLEQRRDLYELLDLAYGGCRNEHAAQDKGAGSGKGRGHGIPEDQADIACCTARLVANRVSFRLKADLIDKLVARLAEITGDGPT